MSDVESEEENDTNKRVMIRHWPSREENNLVDKMNQLEWRGRNTARFRRGQILSTVASNNGCEFMTPQVFNLWNSVFSHKFVVRSVIASHIVEPTRLIFRPQNVFSNIYLYFCSHIPRFASKSLSMPTGVPQGNCPSLKEIKGNFWPKLRKIEEFFHLN